MSKNVALSKPLKGYSFAANAAYLTNVTISNLNLPTDTVESLVSGTTFTDITILSSSIDNTIIGANSPNVGYFSNLTTYHDVNFNSLDHTKNMYWNASTGVLSITGGFSVSGCSLLGNLDICENTIRAVNLNGDINLIPDNLGTIYLRGPINNNVVSQGNFFTNLNDGNVNFIASDYINLNSKNNYINLSSFADQTLTTVNGSINLNTDTGIVTSLIASVTTDSAGNVLVEPSTPSNLRPGDQINITGTNSFLDGTNSVYTTNSDGSFTISTGNSLFTTITTGSFIKSPSNDINLNASRYVTIPVNVELTFGGTSANAISGNTNGLSVTAGGNIIFTNPDSTATSGSYIIEIPQFTLLQFGTSGSNNINFDNKSLNVNGYNLVNVNSKSTDINSYDTKFVDPILTIANYINATAGSSLLSKDKGLQYYYTDTAGNTKLGWFGYKSDTREFTFIPDATNNDNVISGAPGKFNISDISVTNLNMNADGIFDMGCGLLANVRLITGCGGTVNINAGENVNITTSNRIALVSKGDVFIPNNIPLTFGTAGTSIRESTSGNLHETASKNIFLTTQTNGSVVLKTGTKLSFDGTTAGCASIVADTSGNLNVDTNRNVFLNITSGNLIFPANNGSSATQSSIQFGTAAATETISGSTAGINIITSNVLNLEAGNGVNITSSSGNIVLTAKIGDIDLTPTSTSANVRIPVLNRLVFGAAGTSNSLRTTSAGNFAIYGPGTSSTNGTLELKDAFTINLTAVSGGNVNIPTNVHLNIGNTTGTSFITSDTGNNLSITNAGTTGSINVVSSSGNLNALAQNTNVSSNNLNMNVANTATINAQTTNVNGAITNLNTTNVKMTDPVLTLGNYIPNATETSDRGIEYYYHSGGSISTGWFGYKTSTGVFTFYNRSVNTNETITGTLGSFEMATAIIDNGITFTGPGFINMNCGTIANVNTITGCGGTLNVIANNNVNISSGTIGLTATGSVCLPYNIPIAFGDTTNTISSDSNGNMTITAASGSGKLILNSNVQINGTTENIYSTITNIQDPVISIGGVSGPVVSDLMDRGINFKWYNTNPALGSTGSVSGFFGMQNATDRFVFIPVVNSTSDNIYSGAFGDVQFGKGYFSNVDLACGTMSNVNTITGCGNNVLNIVSNTGVNFSTSSLILPYSSSVAFGSTANAISGNSNGSLNIRASSGINLITPTNGNGYINVPNNTPLNLGTSSSLINTTSGNLSIQASSGNINLTPGSNVSGTYGSVILPTFNSIVFSGTNSNNRISSDGQQLALYGYNNIGINSSSVTISGNVNIIGSVNASSILSMSNAYIFPLGTSNVLAITSITQPTQGILQVTTATNNYLAVGDSVTLQYTYTAPVVDGVYTISSVISPNTFRVATGYTLSQNGTTGNTVSVLTTYQGKDVGIEVERWSSSVGNTTITAGSAGYYTGFFGWKDSAQNFVFYSDATISNNVVTAGILGNVQMNELLPNSIGGFTLLGAVSGGNNAIMGSNFQISGGSINSTPIGSVGASTGRFTSLSSTVSANLYNLALQSTLEYSVERYSLSSLLGNSRNPSTSTVVSFVSVIGASFNTYGTMGSANVLDGQTKKIIMSSINTGCTYTLFFGVGNLITPNPLGGSPKQITFKRQGQSVELIYDQVSAAWIITGGVGGYVS